ncbi:MAG: M14 family zinc carboxypeptidase [Chloroflexia bacterium]
MRIANRKRAVLIMCLGIVVALLFGSVPGDSAVAKEQAQGVVAQPRETFYGGYRTVEGMQAFLDGQVAAHPTLAEKVDFGDSWCKTHGPCAQPAPGFNGYDMYALHITNRAIAGPKPVFWYDAGIHPNEITPPELAMRFISWLLDGYESNADARWLVDYHDIWVVPILNPDSHHIVEAGEFTYVQRKNANNTNGCTSYPPSVSGMFGTDLNRNFPFKWACCFGSSDDPCEVDYHGASAASEDETQAVIAQISKLFPDQRGPDDADPAPLTATGIVQSMHNFASLNLYPWGFDPKAAPNKVDLDSIAAHMGAPEAGGNGYKSCQSGVPGCIYQTDGTSVDWIYGTLGVPAFTTELEGDSYTLPYEQVESVWNNNRGMLIYLAKIARTPYLLARGPDSNEVAVEPVVVDAGSQPRISATINYAWPGSNFRQNVGGAEYYVDTPPWAGGTGRPMSAVDSSLDSPAERVEASVDTAGLAPGRHIVFVRGRGVNAYEGQASWGFVSAVFLDVVPFGGTPAPSASPSPSPGLPTPVPSVAVPGVGSRFFLETGKTVSGIFLDYWRRNGGLAQQGYPISELLTEVSELDGKAYTVQYFERAVFEYHPELAGTPFEVLLSQLGAFRYKEKYPNGAPGQVANTSVGSVVFPETGKRLGGIFLEYWRRNVGLAQQGYPISDEFMEVSDLDGKSYRVQYFERAVFEHHPELAGSPFEVLLSQLGTFRYRERYP